MKSQTHTNPKQPMWWSSGSCVSDVSLQVFGAVQHVQRFKRMLPGVPCLSHPTPAPSTAPCCHVQ
eukprot:1468017-Amphidinium_carterae.1